MDDLLTDSSMYEQTELMVHYMNLLDDNEVSTIFTRQMVAMPFRLIQSIDAGNHEFEVNLKSLTQILVLRSVDEGIKVDGSAIRIDLSKLKGHVKIVQDADDPMIETGGLPSIKLEIRHNDQTKTLFSYILKGTVEDEKYSIDLDNSGLKIESRNLEGKTIAEKIIRFNSGSEQPKLQAIWSMFKE